MKSGGDEEWLATAFKIWLNDRLKRGSKPDGDESGKRLVVVSIEAISGRIAQPVQQAANDLIAFAMLVVLIALAFSAKGSANLFTLGAVSRKVEPLVFSGAFPPKPAWIQLFPLFGGLLCLCQNDRLPPQLSRLIRALGKR